MRNFIFIIFITTICSCGQKSKNTLIEKFVIKTYSITLDINIRTTIFYKNYYYCLRRNKQFICLNNKFEVDTVLTNSINQMRFDYTFLSGDTLIAGNYVSDKQSKTYFLDENNKWQPTKKTQYNDPIFFEDENFIVKTCCGGEFGGAIFFTDKKSKRIYSCPTTCATAINRINGCYYVTISLAHMSYTTEILKIEDPTKLYELDGDNLQNGCNWYYSYITYEDNFAGMKQFEIGTQIIFDTIGTLTMTSFIFNNQLYHINTDLKNTFISKIQGDSLLIVDTISNQSLYPFGDENRKYGTMDLHSFDNNTTSGFITISNDTISIITFVNERKNYSR